MFNHQSRRLGAAIAVGCLVAGVFGKSPATAAAVTSSGAMPSTVRPTFIAYDAFIRTTVAAQPQAKTSEPSSAIVADARTFGQMRAYILNHYRSVAVQHSYVLGNAYFDCVVTRTQPSVRDLGIKKIAAPPPPAASHPASQRGSLIATGAKDEFGNLTTCPSGTIPVRRMTLEETTRFPSLAAYLSKQSSGLSRSTIPPDGSHRHAFGFQSVDNHGSNAWLNLWNPSGDFTLSQLWDMSSGSNAQTVEAGWVHYPAKFGDNSVLFSYWTPDNYASGCYDLDCSGFVQTSSSIPLGAPFSSYSVYGGAQYGFGVQYQWYQGNWWLFFGSNAVGYYPGGIYNGGPLSVGGASLVEYGGETETTGTNWPQMGSGQFANAGWTYAAFQENLFYFDTSGTVQDASLSPFVTNPACYSLSIVPASQGGSWRSNIWFGGPGGSC